MFWIRGRAAAGLILTKLVFMSRHTEWYVVVNTFFLVCLRDKSARNAPLALVCPRVCVVWVRLVVLTVEQGGRVFWTSVLDDRRHTIEVSIHAAVVFVIFGPRNNAFVSTIVAFCIVLCL